MAPRRAILVVVAALCLGTHHECSTAAVGEGSPPPGPEDPDCHRCGTCARCVVAPSTSVARRDDRRAPAQLPMDFVLHGRGGRPERLSHDQCELRGLCAYGSQRKLVEQYGAPTACTPPAANGSTCCDATHGTWFPYSWAPQGPPCVQDCAGVWGGEAVVDRCGACGGDGSACADAERTGDAEPDDHQLLLSLLGEHGRAEHPDPALLDAERAAAELVEQRKAVSAADAAAKERRQHTMEQHAAELARRIEEMRSETEQEKAARIACDQDAARVKAEADDALSVAEQRLRTLEAERQDLLKLQAEEQARVEAAIKAEKDRAAQNLLNHTKLLTEERQAVEEARTLTEWQMKVLATEKQQALDSRAKIEAESTQQIEELLQRIESAHGEVAAAKESLAATEGAMQSLQMEHETALARATELQEELKKNSTLNISQLTKHSEGLSEELKQQQADREAAEQAADLAVVDKAAALARAQAEHEQLVATKTEQIAELSAQIASLSAAMDAEKAARIASEQDAARVKADAANALKVAVQDVKEHRAALTQMQKHAAELSHRTEEAEKLHEDEKAARLGAESEIERQAIVREQALLAAAEEERQRLVSERDKQLQTVQAENAQLGRDVRTHLAARDAAEADLQRFIVDHNATLASLETERERALAEKQQQIHDCRHEIAELEKRITQSNSTVAELLEQIETLQTQTQAEVAGRALALEEGERLRQDRDAHMAQNAQLAEQHTAEKSARLSAQESLQKLSTDKTMAEMQHKQEQELLRLEKEARITELSAQVADAKAAIELLHAETAGISKEKESTIAQHAAERQARLTAEREAQEALEQKYKLSDEYQQEKLSRLSAEEAVQRLLTEQTAKESQHSQEKELLRTEQDTKIAELSRHIEHVSKEKDTERRARQAAEEASKKHLSDAKAERIAHREERDRIQSQDEQIQELLRKLEKLGAEREVAVAANLARVAADSQAKMLAVEQGFELALTERVTAQQASNGMVADALDALAYRVDAIADDNGMKLTPSELYCIIGAFVIVPLLFAFVWSRPVLEAAELALRASAQRQSLQDMILARKARRLGGDGVGSTLTPLQVTGAVVFELPEFGEDFREENISKCFTTTVDEIRSMLITQATYGVAWRWVIDRKAYRESVCAAMAVEVETALADLMRSKLSVANPHVIVTTTAGGGESTTTISMTAHIRSKCLDDAAAMLSEFADSTELQDEVDHLVRQKFDVASTTQGAEDRAVRQPMSSLLATVQCCFIANAETTAEDPTEAISLVKGSMRSDTVAEEIWKQLCVTPDDSVMAVERVEVRNPSVPSTVSTEAQARLAPLFDLNVPSGLGSSGSAGNLRGEVTAAATGGLRKPARAGDLAAGVGGVEWLRGVRHRVMADLAGVGLADPGAVCLAAELRMADCALTSLNCANSAVGPIGLRALASALEVCESVTALCIVTDAEVFYGQWRAREASRLQGGGDGVGGDPEVQQLLGARAALLRRIQASILRNQQSRPHQMRFLETDLEIYSKEFAAAAAATAHS